MSTIIHTAPPRQRRRAAAAACFHFLVIVACVGFFGVFPAFGQSAEYSDTYTIDRGAEPEQAVDPETGETLAGVPDNTAASEQVGVGVSEESYDSTVYSVSTSTSITTPSGATVASGYSDGYTYSVAEAISLPLTANSEQGEYVINSTHRYYYDYVEPECQGVRVCPIYNNARNSGGRGTSFPLFTKASYNPLAGGSSLLTRGPASARFVRVSYTFFRWGLTIIWYGYELSHNFTCARAYPGRYPFLYNKICFADQFFGCPDVQKFCASASVPFVQGIRFKIGWGWVSYCTKGSLSYSFQYPFCGGG